MRRVQKNWIWSVLTRCQLFVVELDTTAGGLHCRAHNHLKSELFDVVSIIMMMMCYKKNLQAKKFNKQRHVLMRMYLCHATPKVLSSTGAMLLVASHVEAMSSSMYLYSHVVQLFPHPHIMRLHHPQHVLVAINHIR